MKFHLLFSKLFSFRPCSLIFMFSIIGTLGYVDHSAHSKQESGYLMRFDCSIVVLFYYRLKQAFHFSDLFGVQGGACSEHLY